MKAVMYPDNSQQDGQVNTSPQDEQSGAPGNPASNKTALNPGAANVIRGQINAIYNGGGVENTPHTSPAPISPKPIQAVAQTAPSTNQPQSEQAPPTHNMPTRETTSSKPAPKNSSNQDSRTPDKRHLQATPEQWRQYHSSWQQYYQTYYERYYVNHLRTKEQELSTAAKNKINEIQASSSNPTGNGEKSEQEEAVQQLRAQIRQKVRVGAKKVKKSRHFIPVLAGTIVLLVFMFLQYNRVIFGAVAAYTTPGNISPQNIIVDPSVNVPVGPEPRLIIPKINVDAPVVYGAAADYHSQMTAMARGVAHFSVPGANAVPGQIGNTVLAGHSSNDAFAQGDYKFIFAQNEKLVKDDIIYTNYNSKRYTYRVTSTEVVMPTEIDKIQLSNNKPMLTLISCVPLGTAQKRLLVFAEQISPDPNKAVKPTMTGHPDESTSENIPGKPAPTLLERLFGAS